MSNKQKLIIIGSGETALIAFEYFSFDSDYEVSAFSVNQEFIKTNQLNGLPVVPFEQVENLYPPESYKAFVAISSSCLNRKRKKLFIETKNKGYNFASYISSKAFIWKNVKIGINCFIFENNTLQPFVEIGDNVILWSGNHIGHRTIIEDHCFVSSHCVVSGFCQIGEHSFLGVNSTIENNIKIGIDNFIGAGAVIRKNTENNQIYQCKQTELSKVNSHRFFKIKE